MAGLRDCALGLSHNPHIHLSTYGSHYRALLVRHRFQREDFVMATRPGEQTCTAGECYEAVRAKQVSTIHCIIVWPSSGAGCSSEESDNGRCLRSLLPLSQCTGSTPEASKKKLTPKTSTGCHERSDHCLGRSKWKWQEHNTRSCCRSHRSHGRLRRLGWNRWCWCLPAKGSSILFALERT